MVKLYDEVKDKVNDFPVGDILVKRASIQLMCGYNAEHPEVYEETVRTLVNAFNAISTNSYMRGVKDGEEVGRIKI